MAKSVLIVEDDGNIADLLRLYLEKEGYVAAIAPDGNMGVEMFRKLQPDLVLLDVMLPGLDGWGVLRSIRQDSQTPVIMLTAKGETNDKVSGLKMGADDYITKPFAIEELLARIRTALRKKPAQQPRSPLLQCGPVAMDVARHQVCCQGTPVELTSREFEVLKLLLENQQIVLSRETFLSKVWGYDYAGETNVVDVYIRYLRSKLDDVCGMTLIHTVRGVGYVLREG